MKRKRNFSKRKKKGGGAEWKLLFGIHHIFEYLLFGNIIGSDIFVAIVEVKKRYFVSHFSSQEH